MFSERGIEVLAGAVLLGIFVSLVVFIAVGVDIDTDVDDFRGTLEDIVGNRSRYLVSHSFSILGNFLIIASAALLYLLFREYDRSLAMLGAFALVAAGATFLAADAVALALEPLAQDVAATVGPQRDTLLSSARSFALASKWGNFVGITFIGLSVLSFGALIVWSRPIPRLLGWLGVGGGILLVLVWLVAISDALFVIPFIGLIAVLLWLLTLGTWLIARGVKAPSLW